MLVHLRKGETFADLAAGFAVATATAWRYARETIMLLAARAPKLRDALAAAKKARLTANQPRGRKYMGQSLRTILPRVWPCSSSR